MNLTNLQPSPPDARDHIASLPVVPSLPSVDLKPLVTEVENQYNWNTCTANAGCSALELLYNKNKIQVDLSRLFLYYYTRKLGNITGDGGSYPRDIGKALKTYGVCPELSWDYTVDNLEKEPAADVVTLANAYKIVSYERLAGENLSQIKNALSQGIPVLLSIAVHAGMYSLLGDWKTHTWNYTTSPTNSLLGWHEVLVIGYDDASGRLLVENSWGSLWGDGGFFGIPYDMTTSPSFGELWVLTPNYNLGADVVPVPTPAKTLSTIDIVFRILLFVCLVSAAFNFIR